MDIKVKAKKIEAPVWNIILWNSNSYI